jgi:hypothetical protein
MITKTVAGPHRPGAVVSYNLEIASPYGTIGPVVLTDTLPAALSLISDSVSANNGTALAAGDTLTWTGTLTNGDLTTISFQAAIGESALNQLITNTVVSMWQGYPVVASAAFDTVPRIFIPAISRNFCPPHFFDGFNIPSGWPVGSSDLVSAQLADGEYRIVSQQPFLFLFRSPACDRVNYVVEADMRWNGETGSDLGLLFGMAGDFSQYYFADINTDLQAYAIFRRNPNGTFSTVAPPALSSAIHSGTESNHIRVARVDNQIHLAINGQAIGTWHDGSSGSLTFVGLAMAPYEDRPVADARFDNFSVTTENSTIAAVAPLSNTNANALRPWWQPFEADVIANFEWLRQPRAVP